MWKGNTGRGNPKSQPAGKGWEMRGERLSSLLLLEHTGQTWWAETTGDMGAMGATYGVGLKQEEQVWPISRWSA